jgi:hypothetical protein
MNWLRGAEEVEGGEGLEGEERVARAAALGRASAARSLPLLAGRLAAQLEALQRLTQSGVCGWGGVGWGTGGLLDLAARRRTPRPRRVWLWVAVHARAQLRPHAPLPSSATPAPAMLPTPHTHPPTHTTHTRRPAPAGGDPSAALEQLCWLVSMAAAVLADEAEGETPLPPLPIVAACEEAARGGGADPAQALSGALLAAGEHCLAAAGREGASPRQGRGGACRGGARCRCRCHCPGWAGGACVAA